VEFSTETTPTQVLLLGEIATTVLVFLGVRAIRAKAVHRHRTLMLWSLGLNLGLLASFLVVDVIRASNTVQRGLTAPLYVFLPMLAIHLAIAISALTLAIWAWRIARTGVQRDGNDRVVDLHPEIRARHRKISKYYPALWYATLLTGLLLYAVLYIRF
jgi:putative membrane protein